MELHVTIVDPRARVAREVVVRAGRDHTAADLVRALAPTAGPDACALAVDGQQVPSQVRLGVPPLVNGAQLTLCEALEDSPEPTVPSPALVCVTAGPDAGMCLPLGRQPLSVGRAVARGLRLHDRSLSRIHAEVRQCEGHVLVRDLASTNGTIVDGQPVPPEGAPLTTRGEAHLGASVLALRPAHPPRLAPTPTGDGYLLLPTPPPTPAPCEDSDITLPRLPTREAPGRVPWVAGLLPVPVALLLAVFWGPQVMVFALLGPLILFGTAAQDRWGSRRRHAAALENHAREHAEAWARVEAALARDLATRHTLTPDPAAVLQAATGPTAGLWRRRSHDAGTGVVRLGLGVVTSSVRTVVERETVRQEHPCAPVTLDLARGEVTGVAGDRAAAVLRWFAGQLAVALPPSQLAIILAAEPSGEWAWVRWLPHVTGSSTEPDEIDRLVRASADRAVLVLAPHLHADLLPRLDAMASGKVWVVGADPRGAPPGAIAAADCDGVGLWWVEQLARALAPLRVAGEPPALTADRPLSLRALADITSADDVVDRWSSSTGSPASVLGISGHAPFVLDLVRDGPHVLLGGTTGSGKSEFLRTLVCGLALTCSPEDLSVVLIDYKGGATFAPLSDLPHCAGLVTDLDDRLADRALVSLRAELTRREHLLAAAGSADLDDYRRRHRDGDPRAAEPLPRLVLVIDEFRVLSEELPAFVSGMVRLATVGRSLGVHLVLATQRPSGVVTPDIQANVSARIAFRVRDTADSQDVIDAPDAAAISPRLPGAGLLRLAGGDLTSFQAARVVTPEAEPDRVQVLPAGSRDACAPDSAGDELAEIIRLTRAAARRVCAAPPRAPWLPPLPAELDRDLPRIGEDPVWAVADDPAGQRQEPVTWRERRGLLIVGTPASGRTTTLVSIALRLMARHSPQELCVYAVGTAPAVTSLGRLPHVVGIIGPDDLRGLWRLHTRLRSHLLIDGGPQVLLLVDGWEQLVGGRSSAAWAPVVEPLVHLLRSASPGRMSVLVSGELALVHSTLAAATSEIVALGLRSPADAAALGVRAPVVPDCPPGRGLLLPGAEDVMVARVPAGAPEELVTRWAGLSSPFAPLTTIPHQVARTGLSPVPGRLALGLGGDAASVVHWSLAEHGSVMLIAGPPRAGRSTAAVTAALARCSDGQPLVVIGARRDSAPASVPGSIQLTAADREDLIRLKREHPALTVIVEDVDGLDGSPVDPVIRELVEVAERDHSLVILTTASASIAVRFRGLDVEIARRSRAAILLWPTAERGAADVLRARDLDGIPSVPGRAVLISPTETIEVQIACDV